MSQPDVDTLRLAIADAGEEAGGGFQVLVYVNEEEMTSAGAGLGMEPSDLFVPINRFVAKAEPHRIPIARCTCGVYGCGSTDVTIKREGDLVRWEWLIEVPMKRGVTFAAEQYDAEVNRLAADHSWETPEITAGRLILTNVDRETLLGHGLVPSWAATYHRDHALFRVALHLDNRYQIFVDTAWRHKSPEQLAAEVCAKLSLPPDSWEASWHAIQPADPDPPPFAGGSWRREQY